MAVNTDDRAGGDLTAAGTTVDRAKPEVLELIKRELHQVELAARQTFRKINGLIELDELVSAGREGLFEAARRFDASQGVPFGAYANYRIRGAILDTVRRSSRLPRSMHRRIAASQASGLVGEGSVAHIFTSIDTVRSDAAARGAIDDHLASVTMAAIAQIESDESADSDVGQSPSHNPEKALERREMLELIRQALPGLNTLERSVIEGEYFEHLTPDEIAKKLNCTRTWVSRLHTRAMEQLSKRLAGAT